MRIRQPSFLFYCKMLPLPRHLLLLFKAMDPQQFPLLVNDVGLLAPLLVATELLELSIMSGQTTASAGAQNTIKVTLTAASTLYSGCHMTVPHDGPNVRSGRLVGFS